MEFAIDGKYLKLLQIVEKELSGGGAHTLNEFIETAPLERGLRQLVNFVKRAWK